MRPSKPFPKRAMYVCVCKCVSDQDIRRAVGQGANSFEEVQACTDCATCCGCCETEARELVEATLAVERRAVALPAAA